MTKPILQDAFDHNAWATLTLIDACAALTPEQLEMTARGTYGSVIATLRHIVAADVGYLLLFRPDEVSLIDDDAEAKLSLDDMRRIMHTIGPIWADLLAGDLDPDADWVRHRPDGTDSHAPLGLRLAQVVHHGTDHRSQICTILTTLGIEPPEIDVWAFASQAGRLTVVPSST
jgi:uncharacterized damage-inducible protein DinB